MRSAMVLYAKDLVEKDVLSLPGTTDALTAAKTMRERRRGFVIVAGPDGSPKGIVTEWDYVAGIVAEGRDPAKVRIEELMTKELVAVDGNEGIDRVAAIMATKGVRRVVVTHGGKVLGFVTERMILVRLKDYVDNVSSLIARAQTPPY